MSHFRIFFIFCLLTFLSIPFAAAAQNCRDSIRRSTPDTAFVLHENGTATHNATGLMWMRCSLGQQWQNNTCGGVATGMTWGEALKAAAAHEFAGYSDWRIPNKNELESIVEEACIAPAINNSVFPKTPQTFFWSSSPYAGQASGVWSVDFGYGTVSASVKTGKIQVRLVRDVVW